MALFCFLFFFSRPITVSGANVNGKIQKLSDTVKGKIKNCQIINDV